MKTTINIEWWRNDHEEISEQHEYFLEESALNHIAEMVPKGYTAGELIENIVDSDEDPEDGISFSGWWNIETINH